MNCQTRRHTSLPCAIDVARDRPGASDNAALNPRVPPTLCRAIEEEWALYPDVGPSPAPRIEMLGHDESALRARLIWQGPGGAALPGPTLELSIRDAPVSSLGVAGFAQRLLHRRPLPG